jgi:hypothetical protein
MTIQSMSNFCYNYDSVRVSEGDLDAVTEAKNYS